MEQAKTCSSGNTSSSYFCVGFIRGGGDLGCVGVVCGGGGGGGGGRGGVDYGQKSIVRTG